MAQLTGSGPGNGTNYAMVDNSLGTNDGRLWIAQIGDTGNSFAQDKSTNATTTIGYEHHEIHDGGHYNIRGFESLGVGENITFGFQTSAGSQWAHLVFEITGTNQTEIRGWEGATISGGTVVPPINNNRNSTKTCGCIITSNPVVSGTSPTSGTLIESHSQGLTGTPPTKASQNGTADRGDEWILKSGTTYMWEIKAVGASIIDYAARWYMHTDKTQQF